MPPDSCLHCLERDASTKVSAYRPVWCLSFPTPDAPNIYVSLFSPNLFVTLTLMSVAASKSTVVAFINSSYTPLVRTANRACLFQLVFFNHRSKTSAMLLSYFQCHAPPNDMPTSMHCKTCTFCLAISCSCNGQGNMRRISRDIRVVNHLCHNAYTNYTKYRSLTPCALWKRRSNKLCNRIIRHMQTTVASILKSLQSAVLTTITSYVSHLKNRNFNYIYRLPDMAVL